MIPEYRAELPERPARIARLPLSAKGYPIPYFVSYVDGEPDFRAADIAKMRACVRDSRCWICGDILGRHKTFAIGPMCVVNRISAEPPSHHECAHYAARACPFLLRPNAQRRTANLPENAGPMPGITVARNPGVTALWTTRSWQFYRAPDGMLFEAGEPEKIEWFAQGRLAQPEEIWPPFESGVAILARIAAQEGERALDQLQDQIMAALQYLPPRPSPGPEPLPQSHTPPAQ